MQKYLPVLGRRSRWTALALSAHSPKIPCHVGKSPSALPMCRRPALQKVSKWTEGRLTFGGLGKTSGQSERCREPAFITKTNTTVELALSLESGSPDPKHLHNQQFQHSLADSSGGKGGCACWGAWCSGRMLASGPPGPAKGCGLTGRLCVHPSPASSPPSSVISHSGSGAAGICRPAGRSASTAPVGRAAESRAAFRTQKPDLPLLILRRPPQRGQPSNLRRTDLPRTDPPTRSLG